MVAQSRSSHLQPSAFAFTTPDTLHPTPVLTRLSLTQLRTTVAAMLV
ncbi:MAG: hypothetical protein KME27_15270 [Lyngbya sp. HA4199-MV5]|nr:hypothetical protein [Lyngbya sp. HA4199-MV5]